MAFVLTCGVVGHVHLDSHVSDQAEGGAILECPVIGSGIRDDCGWGWGSRSGGAG